MLTTMESTVRVDTLSPEEAVLAEDIEIAELAGLNPDDLATLLETKIYHLGNISVLNSTEEAAVKRYHCGPVDLTKRGGTKFKGYASEALQNVDGVDHGRAMLYKLWGVGEIDYGGGKTIANFNPREHSPEQRIDAMRQTARGMKRAGLAHTRIDGTAGDEGTNGDIVYYVDELREQGVPHPEACITGKPDMAPRAAATGRGAAIVQRKHMKLEGRDAVSAAVQGGGFAGLYYAAEAYDPFYPDDKQQQIGVNALGDLDPGTGRPATLVSYDSEGLPITQDIADAILLHPTEDRDMRDAKGYKLAALAQKLDRAGAKVDLVDRDVLTYEQNGGPELWLAPAATSNVITLKNIDSISAENIHEIGNHTVHADAMPVVKLRGIRMTSGEENNAGGTYMSTEEHRRDLARIEALEAGVVFDEPTDAEYTRRLHERMTATAQKVHNVSEALGIEPSKAIRVVALANYAIAHDMQVDSRVRQLVAA